MAPTNHVDLTAIMTALGGRQAMQDVLGVGASAISNYVARGSIPTHVRSKLYNALTARGYHVRLGDLSIICGPDTATNPAAKPMILLIIGGGIAAYKALETARQMQRLGLDVTGVMTKSAGQFITPLSVAALTNQKCYDDLFSLTDEAEMGHIRLARSADLLVVMPATANLMDCGCQGACRAKSRRRGAARRLGGVHLARQCLNEAPARPIFSLIRSVMKQKWVRGFTY